MENLFRDLGQAFRGLRRSPGFTVVALLTLAIGLGATMAIFSVVDAVLLRPLPYPDSERIVRLWSIYSQRDLPPLNVSDGEYFDYREQSQAFEALGVHVSLNANLTGEGEPERVLATYTSAGFFPALGTQPALGRAYGADEDGPQGQPVAVISHGLWRRRFGASPGIVGGTIEINGRTATILGVMPEGFDYPQETEVWSPLGLDPAEQAPRGQHYLTLIARLKPGVSLESAQQDVSAVASRFGERFPVDYPPQSGWSVRLVPLLEDQVGDTRPALLVLASAVALLLLIACVNVANLLLVRAQTQEREVAIRVALGANRRRLIRHSFSETLLLSLAGGALGLLAAHWGLAALLRIDPEAVPRAQEIGLDVRVVTLALGLALLTGLALSLVPVVKALRPDLQATIKEGSGKATASRGARRFRRLLVGAEVALAMLLLIGAALVIRSFSRLSQVSPGFRAERLLTLGLSLPRATYAEDRQVAQFYDRLLDRIAAVPGVEGASSVSYLPFSGAENRSATVGAEGQPFSPGQSLPEPDVRAVDHRYFRTMEIPLRAGREFTAADDENAFPMAILDEVAAQRLWPDQEAVGKRFKMGPPTEENPSPWITVVGVAGEVKQMGLDAEPRGVVYFPQLRRIERAQYLVVRTASADPMSVAGSVRAAIREVSKDQPVSDVKTMEQRLSASLAGPRFTMALMSVFAVLAAILAAVGIYGVVAYTVAERTHEIGIRMALGARRGAVLGMIVTQGMAVVLAGLAVGLVAAFWATRGLAGLLYGVETRDPLTFVAVPLFLALVALVANLAPARRATRVEPVIALRRG
ncbi:MAG TPA: ABC transporter permease [Thermoanaerobaculia bacterium]|nr:ABC transporter permease [Thermoanaerobaculia bacterium]